jgi:hypothetical protein
MSINQFPFATNIRSRLNVDVAADAAGHMTMQSRERIVRFS